MPCCCLALSTICPAAGNESLLGGLSLKSASLPRVAYIANNPAPYRIPVFNAVGASPDFDFHVLFSTEREPTRSWDLAEMTFGHTYMKPFFLTKGETFMHANPDVWSRLRSIKPSMIVLAGFNPTNLMAFVYGVLHGCKLGLLIDGTDDTEARLSHWHRWVRRLVYPRLSVAMGPSKGTFRLFASYGVKSDAMFKSHLCANNQAFEVRAACRAPDVDLIFCGRFTSEKHPLFALDVAEQLAAHLQREVSILMVGGGPQDELLRRHATTLRGVRVEFAGFARQNELPEHYARARVCLFPSAGDAWGVVANEACASGVPVVVSPHAGVVGDLIEDGVTGYVRDLDLGLWSRACADLLIDDVLYHRLSMACQTRVRDYTFENAAHGLMEGIRYALLADCNKGVRSP